MPDGKTHLTIWKKHLSRWVVACISLAFVMLLGDWPIEAVLVFAFAGLGYVFGYYVDPDLDQVGLSSAEGRMLRDFPGPGAVVAAWWLVYGYVAQTILGGHRAFLTHFPGVSTIIRVAWTWLPICVIMWVIRFPIPDLTWWAVVGMWLGLSFADYLHWRADMRSTRSKRRRR